MWLRGQAAFVERKLTNTSGRRSAALTAPFVASSIALHRSGGTRPRAIQLLTADWRTPTWRANCVTPPTSFTAFASPSMGAIITLRDVTVNTLRVCARPRVADTGRMDTFGRRLRAARKARGMTQEALAHAAHLKGQNAISNYERAERSPRMHIVEALAAALGDGARAELMGNAAPLVSTPRHAAPELGDVALLLGYVAQALAQTSPAAAANLSRALASLPQERRASEFVSSFAASLELPASRTSVQSRGSKHP